MRSEKLCSELEDALVRLGWKIRMERGNFYGGACRLSGEQIIIINRRLSIEDKIEIYSQTLREAELDTLYLLPEIREFLEGKRTSLKSETNEQSNKESSAEPKITEPPERIDS